MSSSSKDSAAQRSYSLTGPCECLPQMSVNSLLRRNVHHQPAFLECMHSSGGQPFMMSQRALIPFPLASKQRAKYAIISISRFYFIF